MEKITPIRRDKSLFSLSKDHHDGLLLVWKTRQGVKLNIDAVRIVTYIVKVFDKELEPHFLEEENLLFIKLDTTDEFRIKAEQQHTAIRKMIAAFTLAIPEVSDLLQFATLLDEHIRFEERILFPYLEKIIPRNELDKIGEQLDASHALKECVLWYDEFWIKK